METLFQSSSLVQRARWLIRLRWAAIAGLASATFVANKIMNVGLPVAQLYLIAMILLFYNFVLFDLMRYVTWGGKVASPTKVSQTITFQISADLIILTVILHFSGGIENPFFLYFVFHMILASILLSTLQSYLQATFAVFLFGMLILLECFGIIPHHPLSGFVVHDHYRDGLFVFGTFVVFTTTIYLVVYMTTSISKQLRNQQQELGDANRLLKQKDQLKNEYVLRLTHDIRGHLAAIQSCLDIVVDQMVGPLNEKQMDLVGRAYQRAGKCMNFISALLKLTSMKLGGRLDKVNFSVRHMVFNALAAVEGRTTKKNIALSYEIDGSLDEIYGEPVLIEECLTNLLFNAARYTPEKGKIDVKVKDEDDTVLVQVTDTGIGVPEGELDKIFEELYRAENARKVERDGTGLGLSIAKQIVERHGGQIWAENNEGGGSTFSFRLPKSPRSS
jgi:signal transduction histidine kinase